MQKKDDGSKKATRKETLACDQLRSDLLAKIKKHAGYVNEESENACCRGDKLNKNFWEGQRLGLIVAGRIIKSSGADC